MLGKPRKYVAQLSINGNLDYCPFTVLKISVGPEVRTSTENTPICGGVVS